MTDQKMTDQKMTEQVTDQVTDQEMLVDATELIHDTETLYTIIDVFYDSSLPFERNQDMLTQESSLPIEVIRKVYHAVQMASLERQMDVGVSICAE